MKITKYKVNFGYFLKITKMYMYFVHRAYPNHFYLSLYPSCETHGQLSIFRLKFSWWGCWRLKRLISFTNNFKTKFLDFFFIDKYLLAISMIFRILMRIRWVVYCPSSLLLDGLHKNFKRYTFFWGFEHPPPPIKIWNFAQLILSIAKKLPFRHLDHVVYLKKLISMTTAI